MLSYENKWNNNRRSVKWGGEWSRAAPETEILCVNCSRLYTIRPTEYYFSFRSLRVHIREIEMNARCAFVSVFVGFSWWCTALMKLRSLDKQPILSSWWPAAALASPVFAPLLFSASLGLFSFVICWRLVQTFFCLLFISLLFCFCFCFVFSQRVSRRPNYDFSQRRGLVESGEDIPHTQQ